MAIVKDVARYPEFLKWVRAARATEAEAGTVNADIIVGHRLLSAPIAAHLQCSTPQQIDIRYRRGPVRDMSSRWTFEEFETKLASVTTAKLCRVTVVVDLDPGLMLAPIIDGVFDQAIDKLVDAFEQRAHQIYGDQEPVIC